MIYEFNILQKKIRKLLMNKKKTNQSPTFIEIKKKKNHFD